MFYTCFIWVVALGKVGNFLFEVLAVLSYIIVHYRTLSFSLQFGLVSGLLFLNENSIC